MRCDTCGADHPFFDLIWNGRYRHADTICTQHKYKMLVCLACYSKEGELLAKYPELKDKGEI